ncbi:MAG: nucleotide exchange factor GrpE [Burkholderiales bacterium]|nr:nucleotide exchange factor GrpE [Burkholderiales bacterium]GIK86508.1 MAG: protein GrpE [Betaproteobacteria bacterium]
MQEHDTRPAEPLPPGAAASAPGGDAAAAANDVADTDERLRRAESEAAELKDAWLRARAETENVRRQAADSVAKASKFAIERFAEDLLPVKDALEQALAVDATPDQLRAGVELTLRQLAAVFARAQIAEVDPKGEKFDPHRHQAMQVVPSDQPANTVVDVVQKGYLLNERVLRPAMVTVAKSPEA